MVNEGWSSGKNVMLGRSNSKGDVPNNNNNSLANELELLLLQNEHQERQGNLNLFGGGGGERDQSLHRSGSAPPTVEGAFSAAGSMLQDPNFASHGGGGGDRGVLSEEEIRSHPAYLAYYYSNENLNPRLPPPLLSREDWRIAQRVQAGGPSIGDFGDLRYNALVGDGGNSMLLQPQLSLQKVEDDLMELRKAAVRNLSLKNSADFLEGSSSGLQKPALGSRKKSFADIVQGGGSQPATSSGHLLRPSSHNSIGDALPTSSVAESSSSELQNIAELTEASRHRQPLPGSSRSAVIPGTFPSARESLPGFLAVLGQVSVEDELRFLDAKLRDLSTNDRDISHLLVSFPGSEGAALHSPTHMPLSSGHNQNLHQHFVHNSGVHNLLNAPNYDEFAWGNRLAPQANYHSINFDREVNAPRRSASLANLQSRFNPSEFAMCNQGLHSGTNPNGHGLWRSGIPSHSNLHSPAALPRNHSIGNIGSSHPDLHELDRMYIESLLAQQQQQQLLQFPLFYNPGNINHQPGNPGFGQHVMYRGNQMVNSFHPTFDSEIYNFLNEQILRMPGTLKNQVGGSPRSRSPVLTLLEELKNTKGRPPELSDVIDHVVELSMDQYGSRFIQQKLETASTEDRFKIFSQIITHARGLMTHVFGNYVIQKLFEQGTQSQTKDLANQLVGHVLPLSLQMYGCRVIQKALEVVDADQQMQLVSELKGSVMKCVQDQNGNHVIQKCIERIPHERIQFIITTFYGQVVALSIHPYGCRVIQRVLEHSADPNTQKTILDEIMESVCTLAQDQYGNYVIQHVMQHGKPHDRSEIIAKLAGQIVKMSQQKFASNVIEKCLTFGSPEQRQLLINEMLGSTEENEPLQAMMKDPFGNYVVQKVLETCDDQSRELIISRIKVHLYTLEKFTYGKHIVSRIEKLISSGEKHMGVSST